MYKYFTRCGGHVVCRPPRNNNIHPAAFYEMSAFVEAYDPVNNMQTVTE
jgi:hypothetical protein